ncbi:hypothetical protein FACS1894186_4570 [Alphaproteobacteria bacterium]|nr:hypothetical protein FACS1894186_4570 [Alphaproteobacteria bacterium]
MKEVIPLSVEVSPKADEWIMSLKDLQGRAEILDRLLRLGQGLFGERRDLKDGLWELKIDTGPGYRLYYMMRGRIAVLVLAGGTKKGQEKDIKAAKAIVKKIREEEKKNGGN